MGSRLVVGVVGPVELGRTDGWGSDLGVEQPGYDGLLLVYELTIYGRRIVCRL